MAEIESRPKREKRRSHRCGSCISFEHDKEVPYSRGHCSNPEAIKDWPQTRIDGIVPTILKVRQSDSCAHWASYRGKAVWLRTKDSAICPKLKVALRIEVGSRITPSPCYTKDGTPGGCECIFLGSPILVNAREREVSIKCFYKEGVANAEEPTI